MTFNVVVFIQARMGSSRFPGKVLAPISEGKVVLEYLIERIKRSQLTDEVVVLTSDEQSDDDIERFCLSKDYMFFRGDLENVLSRFVCAHEKFPSKHIVRITADCPLIAPELLDDIIKLHLAEGCDYTSNIEPPTFPDGLDIEVFTKDALSRAFQNAKLPGELEHVTPFLRESSLVSRNNFKSQEDFSSYRITVDYPEDLSYIKSLIKELGVESSEVNLERILDYVERHPRTDQAARNVGLIDSVKKDLLAQKKLVNGRYKESCKYLERALKVIPLASQTFSKSVTQMPVGAAPLFIEFGDGVVVTDIDGNEYIDFVNSLLCINLGYGYPAVKDAVTKQLNVGTIFSLPSRLEAEVAELLVETIPSAEQVRFAKNGTDVTSAAVRLARAHTGKKYVVSCGYHGWQDWYIGVTSKNLGVPEEVSDLTRTFEYNSIESLRTAFEELGGDVACVIMEPMTKVWPKEGFLEEVRELCTELGAVLVFDEMITGFRFSSGGAQELFGVIPDLSCFGKGIANGYPLSAIVGKESIMKKMEDIFFSGTFGGELLSLAAAKATIKEVKEKGVTEHIAKLGARLMKELNLLIKEYGFQAYFECNGHPSWTFFDIKPSEKYDFWELKTFYIQEMLLQGVYIFGTHNLSFSHKEEHIEHLLACYRSWFNKLKTVFENNSEVTDFLCCEPLQPLFKVRG